MSSSQAREPAIYSAKNGQMQIHTQKYNTHILVAEASQKERQYVPKEEEKRGERHLHSRVFYSFQTRLVENPEFAVSE